MRTLIPLSAMLAVGAGCAGQATVADTDGDGLADVYELEIGSDPELADTDGDGWSDYDEIYQFTELDDPDSHPYTGGWERHPVPEGLGDDSGRELGDVMEDFVLVDQFGDEVDLYHFYGEVVVVESAAEW